MKSGLSKTDSWRIFEKIAKTYDRLNSLLSFGLDGYWRAKLTQEIGADCREIVDCACGTGKVIVTLLSKNVPRVIFGVDRSESMLNYCRNNFLNENRVKLIRADLNDLPFANEIFPLATCAFGIRNIERPETALTEIRRILKPGGRFLILEFSLPRASFLKKAMIFYLRRVIPAIGGWLSGNKPAYCYLGETIESFPSGVKFLDLLKSCGWQQPSQRVFFPGVVSLYSAYK